MSYELMFTGTREASLRSIRQHVKKLFLGERCHVLSQLPEAYRVKFGEMGQYEDQMVLVVSPYDVGPGSVRERWFDSFKTLKAVDRLRDMPLLVYHYFEGEDCDELSSVTGSDRYSMICQQDFVSVNTAPRQNLSEVVQRALETGIEQGLSQREKMKVHSLRLIGAHLKSKPSDRRVARPVEVFSLLQLATGQVEVGIRVDVWWPAESKYFAGTVTKCRGSFSYIVYDDGTEEWTAMDETKYNVILSTAGGPACFPDHSSPDPKDTAVASASSRSGPTAGVGKATTESDSAGKLAGTGKTTEKDFSSLTSASSEGTHHITLNADQIKRGYVLAKKAPRLLPNGRWSCPQGRPRGGMIWDDRVGAWKPETLRAMNETHSKKSRSGAIEAELDSSPRSDAAAPHCAKEPRADTDMEIDAASKKRPATSSLASPLKKRRVSCHGDGIRDSASKAVDAADEDQSMTQPTAKRPALPRKVSTEANSGSITRDQLAERARARRASSLSTSATPSVATREAAGSGHSPRRVSADSAAVAAAAQVKSANSSTNGETTSATTKTRGEPVSVDKKRSNCETSKLEPPVLAIVKSNEFGAFDFFESKKPQESAVDTLRLYEREIWSWLPANQRRAFGQIGFDRKKEQRLVLVMSPFDLEDEMHALNWLNAYQSLKQRDELGNIPFVVRIYNLLNPNLGTAASADIGLLPVSDFVAWEDRDEAAIQSPTRELHNAIRSHAKAESEMLDALCGKQLKDGHDLMGVSASRKSLQEDTQPGNEKTSQQLHPVKVRADSPTPAGRDIVHLECSQVPGVMMPKGKTTSTKLLERILTLKGKLDELLKTDGGNLDDVALETARKIIFKLSGMALNGALLEESKVSTTVLQFKGKLDAARILCKNWKRIWKHYKTGTKEELTESSGNPETGIGSLDPSKSVTAPPEALAVAGNTKQPQGSSVLVAKIPKKDRSALAASQSLLPPTCTTNGTAIELPRPESRYLTAPSEIAAPSKPANPGVSSLSTSATATNRPAMMTAKPLKTILAKLASASDETKQPLETLSEVVLRWKAFVEKGDAARANECLEEFDRISNEHSLLTRELIEKHDLFAIMTDTIKLLCKSKLDRSKYRSLSKKMLAMPS